MSEASARPLDEAGVEKTLDESGTVLGERYRLLRPLGEGGAGIVYAATDERIGAEVAIKVVRGSARRDEVTLARFHREARAAGRLGHPNIVRVMDFGTNANGSPYVVMERLAGETLEARIARVGRLDPKLAIDVHVQLSDALAAAHAAGVLHRDVKPANVFLTQLATGQVLVKLLDFGLAELYEEPASPRLTERGLLVGSLAYLAPERLLGATANEQSDVWGIGASLYESLVGTLPFEGPNPMMTRARILEGAPLSFGELEPTLGVSLVEVVRDCLAREPSGRVPSAAEARRRLLAANEGRTHVEPAPLRTPPRVAAVEEPAPPIAAPASRRGVLVGAVVACMALAIGWMLSHATSEVPVVDAAPPTPVASPAPTPTLAAPAPEPPSAAPALDAVPIATPAIEAPTPVATPRRARRPESAPAPSEPPVVEEPPPSEPPPSRFDQIQEPDWGAPLPH